MNAPSRWSAIVLSLFFLAGQRAPAQEKLWRPDLGPKVIPTTFTSDWYGVYLGEKKIGSVFCKREPVEGKRIRESLVMKMKIASFGGKTETEMNQELIFEGAPPYRLVRAEARQTAGEVTIRTTVEKADKGYRVIRVLGKIENKSHLDDIDYTLADALVSELWLRSGPKEGESVHFRDFSMEDLRVETQTAKVLERKKSLVQGVPVTFFEVEAVTSRSKKTPMKSLHDEQGRLLSGQVAIFEMRKETEDQAKNTEYAADLFVLGQVKVDKDLGRTETLEELILEVQGKGGAVIPDGPWQKVEAGKDGVRILKIGKKHGSALKAGAAEIKEALEETVALPWRDTKIKELAKMAVGDAGTPEETVKNLVDFTYKYIRPRLSTDPPEIFHLLERKTGDCKSYARLFCVLARASGIPAREVSGFVYMGDDVKAFGGHAWNEVLLEGVWVPVDASINRPGPTVGHVFLGTEREASSILETIGKLNFKLLQAR